MNMNIEAACRVLSCSVVCLSCGVLEGNTTEHDTTLRGVVLSCLLEISCEGNKSQWNNNGSLLGICDAGGLDPEIKHDSKIIENMGVSYA